MVVLVFLVVALATLVPAVILAERHTLAGSGPAVALLLIGIVALAGAGTAAMAWTLRRRGLNPAAGPLAEADPALRRRILRAIRVQQPLTGDEHDLALAEAEHIRRIWPVTVTGLAAAFALLALVGTLALIDVISPLNQWFGLAVLLLGLYRAAGQIFHYRRAGAYLRRFATSHRP